MDGISEKHKEHIALQKIFRITLTDGSVKSNAAIIYLPDLETAIESANTDLKLLSVDKVDLLLEKMIQHIAKQKEERYFPYLSECFHRANDLIIAKSLAVSKSQLKYIQESIIKYAALLVQCPQYFEINLNNEHSKRLFINFVEQSSSGIFLHKILAQIDENEHNDANDIFSCIVEYFYDQIKDRTIGNLKLHTVNTLKGLLSFKRLAMFAVSLDCFLPCKVATSSNTSVKHGFLLETSSLFGRLLTPTPLDGPLYSLNNESNRVAAKYFKNLAISHQLMQANMAVIRNEMFEVIHTTAELIKDLCRIDKIARSAVFRWLGTILCSNENKAKLNHHASLNGQPISTMPHIEALLLRLTGENSFGFGLNVFWLILQLVEPIKYEKLGDLDYFFIVREEVEISYMMGDIIKEALLGENVEEAKNIYKKMDTSNDEPKFTTKIFWLTFKGLRVFYNPALGEFMKVVNEIEKLSHKDEFGNSSNKNNNQKRMKLNAEFYCWKAILLHPTFVESLWHFIHLAIIFILRAMFCYETDGSLSMISNDLLNNNKRRITSIVSQYYSLLVSSSNNISVSPQFSVLPAVFVDDVLTTIKHLIALHRLWLHNKRSTDKDPLIMMDTELVTTFCISVMSSTKHFRNVHTRCDGGSNTIYTIFREDDLQSRIVNNNFAMQHLIPSLATTFIHSQKASYYDRMNFRLPIVEMFQDLLNMEQHRKQFYVLAEKNEAIFVHLVHLLLNDMSYLMEETINNLSEVRRRENEGTMNDSDHGEVRNNLSASTNIDRNQTHNNNSCTNSQDTTNSDDDEEIVNYGDDSNILHTDSRTLRQNTKTVVYYSFKSCSLLWAFTKYCGVTIVKSRSILPQTISCLDCCLFHLVGPRMSHLKVRNMEEYNFKPKEWLSRVCETYVYLMDADAGGDALIREITDEGRYFKPEIFCKAMHFLRRERLMGSTMLDKFGNILKKLSQFQEQDLLLANIDDIPEEFLDPIMQEIMVDPVILPTSNNIMERRHIERHLMSDETDPFTRAPLKKNDLIPASELKQKIEEYLENAKAKLHEKQ